MPKKTFILFLCFWIFIPNLHAFNLRKVAPGIRGSLVNSIYQDTRGLIWLGTNAGISTYNGENTFLLNDFNGIIRIDGSSNGEIFLETLYGFQLLDEKQNSIATFEMFNNVAFSTSDSQGTAFIIQGNGSVYYKTRSQTVFDNIIISDLKSDNIKSFLVDHAKILRIITNDGTLRSFDIIYKNEIVYLNEKPAVKIASGILFCFVSDNCIYTLDNEYKLSEFKSAGNQIIRIADLKPMLINKGKITAGIFFKNEFYFGTETGLFVVKDNRALRVPVKKGVTCLLKDRYQDLIWIGTAGDGVYTYSYDPHAIKSNLLSDFSPSVSKPVSSIYLNADGTLWLGTEGDGIIIIPEFNPDKEITGARLLTDKNGLPDNTVYSLQKSKNGIWIGCKSGLAFYSDKNKSISKIKADNVSLTNIRAVYEQDSLLGITCYRKGMIKASIASKNNVPEIRNAQLYSINNGDEASNRFSSIYASSGNVWLINDGNGIFRFSENDLIKFGFTDSKFNSINHLIAINKTDYIASTDFGILKFTTGKEKNDPVLLNEIASKDILPGNGNDYWISTYNGLVVYDTNLNSFRFFDNSYGLMVTEYCNGASFKDERNGILFFGGINGFTTIRYNSYDEAMDYMPALRAENLTLFGISRNIRNFEKKPNELILKSDENFFSITFNALDYINGNNYTYYYKIGENGQWIENGNSGTISFTDVRPGSYDLFIKYYNKIINKESYSRRLSITVLPPWYRSAYAYWFYFILTTMIVYLVIRFTSKRRQKRKEEETIKAEQHRKEEIHEAKLDFFTDIAHEFCTPLTLISGPCNRILEQKNISPSVAKYAGVINHNAKRMSLLINDLMNFKQMESGYKQPEITRLNVSEIADRVTDAFKIDSAGSRIKIKKHYFAGIMWNSDEQFLTTILINLISNAIKYSDGEWVKIEISIQEDHLKTIVTNKGKGISKEEISGIFNRFSVLDNYKEENNPKQNGLGLAITDGMVKLLSGNIHVNSIPGETTSFTVNLPFLQADKNENDIKSDIHDMLLLDSVIPQMSYEYKEDRPTVTVIDDDPEMLWFICDLLDGEFNVLPVNDPTEAMDMLGVKHTDIILCDIMMKGTDGITLTKTLKSDKGKSHIPLIIISAVQEIEKQMEAIGAGAEMYITKPFNTEYLKTAIRKSLGRKEDLKDYFSSPLSAFELNMGKLQHTEHRKLIRKIYSIINKNIQNKNLSPDFIAIELGMSTRSLYRKLKEATDTGLLDIIHEGRLVLAENLLLKSKFTIDEIVFKSGFNNRAGFYRAFSKKFGCTPTEFKERNTISYT